jgi:hypothetical protein
MWWSGVQHFKGTYFLNLQGDWFGSGACYYGQPVTLKLSCVTETILLPYHLSINLNHVIHQEDEGSMFLLNVIRLNHYMLQELIQ